MRNISAPLLVSSFLWKTYTGRFQCVSWGFIKNLRNVAVHRHQWKWDLHTIKIIHKLRPGGPSDVRTELGQSHAEAGRRCMHAISNTSYI